MTPQDRRERNEALARRWVDSRMPRLPMEPIGLACTALGGSTVALYLSGAIDGDTMAGSDWAVLWLPAIVVYVVARIWDGRRDTLERLEMERLDAIDAGRGGVGRDTPWRP